MRRRDSAGRPAGGGSIAAIAEVGLLKAGRRAPPPTRTPWLWPQRADRARRQSADRLPPPRLLPRRADEVRSRCRSKALGLSTVEAARGVYSNVCKSVAAAARGALVKRGHDPPSAIISHDYLGKRRRTAPTKGSSKAPRCPQRAARPSAQRVCDPPLSGASSIPR